MGGANIILKAKNFYALLNKLQKSAARNELEKTAKQGHHSSGLHFTGTIKIEYQETKKIWVAYYRYEK